MSPRSPEERREDDVQDESLHAVHDAMSETPIPEEAPVSQDGSAHTEKAKQVQSIETTVELDRVAIYLKGPTAFSA